MILSKPQELAIQELVRRFECEPNITLTHSVPPGPTTMRSMVFVMFGVKGFLIDAHGIKREFLPTVD